MEGQSIAERLKRRRIETVEVSGVGPVRIGRVSAGKFLDIVALPEEQQSAELAVACLLDEQDRPLFGSVADFKLIDLETAKTLILQVTKFNGLGEGVADGDRNNLATAAAKLDAAAAALK